VTRNRSSVIARPSSSPLPRLACLCRHDPAGVHEPPDPLDLDRDDVAVAEEPGRVAEDADAARRAGRDDTSPGSSVNERET
jgi:hypothetical protein